MRPLSPPSIRQRLALLAGASALLVVLPLIGFEREHVLEDGSLVDLEARQGNDSLVITGALLPSGAKIVKTTTTFSDGEVLLRVYADGIEPDDRPEDCRGTFRVQVPLSGLQAVSVGESARSVTVGRFFGVVPVRVPRLQRDDSANEIVWRAATANAYR